MKNLYKANLYRMIKRPDYLLGCVIALVVTCAITSGAYAFPFLAAKTADIRMLFTGAAMVLFFSIFPPLFINPEYADGCIRNRIIAGFSQRQVYLSHLLSMVSAMTFMFICYLIGGLIGGAAFEAKTLEALFVLFIAVCAYAVLAATVSFRFRKIIASMLTTMLIFNVCFNGLLFGNAILSILNGAALRVGAVIYNINALGQWFCLTGYADDVANPGSGIQILLSLMIMVISFVFGMAGLDKRDLN